MKHIWISFFVILSTSILLHAQETCDAIVQTAIEAASENCDGLRRNQACYGNVTIDAEAAPDVTDFTFDSAGDIANVSDIASLRLSSQIEETGEWGISMMYVQANLADETSENVQILLYGDVDLENNGLSGEVPLITSLEPPSDDEPTEPSTFSQTNAFVIDLQSSDETSGCDNLPDSGVIIQTPEGDAKISLIINEITVELGSTAYLMPQQGQLRIGILEGYSRLVTNDAETVIPPGAEIVVSATDDDINFSDLQPYEVERLQNLPLELLDREIEISDSISPNSGIYRSEFDRITCVYADGTEENTNSDPLQPPGDRFWIFYIGDDGLRTAFIEDGMFRSSETIYTRVSENVFEEITEGSTRSSWNFTSDDTIILYFNGVLSDGSECAPRTYYNLTRVIEETEQ